MSNILPVSDLRNYRVGITDRKPRMPILQGFPRVLYACWLYLFEKAAKVRIGFMIESARYAELKGINRTEDLKADVMH